MGRVLVVLVGAGVLLSAACARAGQTDKLFSLEAQGSPEVAAGESGRVEVRIRTRDGAYVSDEAPLKIEVQGRRLKVEKGKLTRQDAVKTESGPRFEIPFVGEEKGPGGVDADLVFFICTEKLCERQQRKLSIPVTVK